MPRTKSVLSEQSTALVDKVIEYLSIPANARFYNQDTFGSLLEGLPWDRQPKYPACDTECCIAGWIVFAKSSRLYTARFRSARSSYAMWQQAADLLTLKDGRRAQSSNLFDLGTSWVAPFGRMFAKAGHDRREEAKVAVARLKYFKQHGR